MMKGLPLAYDRDMQEDKAPLFEALDTVQGNVIVFEAMISSAKWNLPNMEKSCFGGFANATDVADYLVRKGLPFRVAHGVSAKCVRLAIDSGKSSRAFRICSSPTYSRKSPRKPAWKPD